MPTTDAMPSDPYLVFLRSHLAREASRSGDLHREALRHSPQDCGKGGCCGRGLFSRQIKPLLADPLIKFIGEIGDSEKSAFLGNAGALLFPIDWPEPFGLVLIEAMAMWNACDRVALRVRLRDR